MKIRFTEEQIIGFLRQAEAGMPIAELCRKHAFSEASYYLWRSKFGGMNVSDAKTAQGAGSREHAAEEAPGRVAARERNYQRGPPKPDVVAKFEALTPLGRLCEPADMTGPVLFLATAASSMVTGHILPVDGGVLAQ